jgi:hypothetical protein
MEVSGQLRAPAALYPGKKSLVPIKGEARLFLQKICLLCRETNVLCELDLYVRLTVRMDVIYVTMRLLRISN